MSDRDPSGAHVRLPGASLDAYPRPTPRRRPCPVPAPPSCAACSGPGGATTHADADRSPPAASPAATPAAPPTPAAAFPVTVTDDEGTAVEIAAEPETIVSLTPGEHRDPVRARCRRSRRRDRRRQRLPGGGGRAPRRRDVLDASTSRRSSPSSPTSSSPAGSASRRPTRSPGCATSTCRSLVVYAPSVDGVYEDIELIGDRHRDERRRPPRWSPT